MEDKPTIAESLKYQDRSRDYCKYLVRNLPTIIKSSALAKDVLQSLKRGEKRSMGDDILKLNEVFGTKVEIEGAENIPESGGVILAISHISSTIRFPGWEDENVFQHWGFAGLTTGLRKARGENADFRLIAVDIAQEYKLQGSMANDLLRMYDGFPLSKINARSARNALEEAKESLDKGAVVIISPEGETYTALTQMRRGVAILASSGSPTVPIAFFETKTDDGYKHTTRFGKPLFMEGASEYDRLTFREKRKSEKQFAQKVGYGLAELLPEEMRGVYS